MDSCDKLTLGTYLEYDDPPPACLDVAGMSVLSRAWLENVFRQTAGDIMACEERCMGVLLVGTPWPWAPEQTVADSPFAPAPAETVPGQPSVAASVEHAPAETVPATPVKPSEAASMERVPAETVPAVPVQPSVAASVEHVPAQALQPGADDAPVVVGSVELSADAS